NCSRRSGEVSITIRVVPCAPVRSTSSEQRRRRFFGLLGSQAPQPRAGRGTPAEEPQPRIVSVTVMRQPSALALLKIIGRSFPSSVARFLPARHHAFPPELLRLRRRRTA